MLKSTRPTAQNLFFEIEQVSACIEQAKFWKEACEKAVVQAKRSADESVEACRSIGRYGAELLQDGDAILTHCNAGWVGMRGLGNGLSSHLPSDPGR